MVAEKGGKGEQSGTRPKTLRAGKIRSLILDKKSKAARRGGKGGNGSVSINRYFFKKEEASQKRRRRTIASLPKFPSFYRKKRGRKGNTLRVTKISEKEKSSRQKRRFTTSRKKKKGVAS